MLIPLTKSVVSLSLAGNAWNLCMRNRGIWLTVLMRGVQLNLLTEKHFGTTAPISYVQCYRCLSFGINN
jgi:hypothetical protein